MSLHILKGEINILWAKQGVSKRDAKVENISLLDDPLRHWRKGKSETALEPQKINCSNSKINSSLHNLIKT
jgi:hypothetical protein